MSATVLFVGGPMDGDLRALPDDRLRYPIAVPVRTSSARAYLQGKSPEVGPPTFNVRTYHPVHVALFGKKAKVPVFVYEDALGGERQNAVLAQHLLSPLGRELVGLA